MTVNSNLEAYCTGTQFTVKCDWRTFAELASDTDVPLASSAALAASPVLLFALQEAAGDIEAAVTIGQRYDPTDLVLLITPDGSGKISNSGVKLIAMNAGIAVVKMFQRRGKGVPEDLKELVEESLNTLAALEEGTAIFAFRETQEAGVLQTYEETPVDVANRNLPSYIARPLFGQRANQYWPRWNGG